MKFNYVGRRARDLVLISMLATVVPLDVAEAQAPPVAEPDSPQPAITEFEPPKYVEPAPISPSPAPPPGSAPEWTPPLMPTVDATEAEFAVRDLDLFSRSNGSTTARLGTPINNFVSVGYIDERKASDLRAAPVPIFDAEDPNAPAPSGKTAPSPPVVEPDVTDPSGIDPDADIKLNTALPSFIEPVQPDQFSEGLQPETRVELAPNTDPESEKGPLPDGTITLSVQNEKRTAASGLDKVAFFVDVSPEAIKSARTRDQVRLSIDYSTFADYAGGDWSGRVQLVGFSSCWFDAASEQRVPVKGCREPKPVEGFVNDREAGVVYADLYVDEIPLFGLPEANPGPSASSSTGQPGFGLSASAYSQQGNFGTSALNPASTWEVGLNSGSFEWSYDLPVPAPPAGPVPDVSVHYSAGSIDGLTSDQNTQGGVLGVGWSTSNEAFIERRYKTCAQDGEYGDGDLCFAGNHTYISMAGQSGILVQYASEEIGAWELNYYRIQQDTGLRVTRYRKLNTTTRGTFGVDNDREFWHAFDTDGTEYWFGYGRATGSLGANRLPSADPMGAITSNPTNMSATLNSVWTVPVEANANHEPCANLSGDWCHQAYRWQLDRVVDAEDRAMVFLYELHKNHYAQNGVGFSPYVSGGTLELINYGVLESYANRDDVATASVHFNYINRCSTPTSGCNTPPSPSSASSYPDLPADMICNSAPCTAQSPTFFQKKILTHTYTENRTNAGTTRFSGMRFTMAWATPGFTYEKARPFLRNVQRYAHSQNYTFPAVRFDSRCPNGLYGLECGMRPNATKSYLSPSPAAGVPAMVHYRVTSILDESGTDTRIRYSQPDGTCIAANSGWNVNQKRCFPRWYVAPNGTQGFRKFNKYRVELVDRVDPLGNTPTIRTRYEWQEPNSSDQKAGMGWRGDSDPFTPLSQRSWGAYRGYQGVTVRVGNFGEPDRSQTTYRFWRGMHGNPNSHTSNLGTQPHFFSLPDGTNQEDWDSFRGMPYKVVNRNDANPSLVYRDETTQPMSVAVTGADSLGRQARRVMPRKVFVNEQNSRYSLVERQYDGQGKITKLLEFGETNSVYGNTNGPTTSWASSGGADERCTTYSYASNANFQFPEGLVKEERLLVGGNCAGTELAKTRNYYDLLAYNASPVRGQLTEQRRYTGASSSVYPSASYVEISSTYETGGWRRLKTTTDARGKSTQHGYVSFSPGQSLGNAVNHNVAKTTLTTPLGFLEETTYDDWGNPIRHQDPNGRLNQACYDVFNRVAKVFNNDHKPTSNYNSLCTGGYDPSAEYSYVRTDNAYSPGTLGTFASNIPSWKTRTIDLYALATDDYVSSSNNSRITAWTFLDGLGRPTETQTHSPTGGVLVTRTRYDDSGRVRNQSAPFQVPGSMGTARLTSDASTPPRDTLNAYDTLGRMISTAQLSNGTAVRSQTTSYPTVYETQVEPWTNAGTSSPFGATRTETDVYGNVVVQTAYRPGTTSYVTKSKYNLRGDLVGTRDPGATATNYTTNNFGWVTAIDDPSAGRSTTTYYQTGEVRSTVDAEQNRITRKIDDRGRIIRSAFGNDPDVFDDRLANYLYDPPSNKGAVREVVSYQRRNNDPSEETDAVSTAKAATFDTMGRPTRWTLKADGTDYSSFSGDEALNDTYTFTQSYTRSGQPYQVGYPAVPGLGAETVTHKYNWLGLLSSVSSPSAPSGKYVSATAYDSIGRQTEIVQGAGAVQLRNRTIYSPSDGRVSRIEAVIEGGGNNSGRYVQNDSYSYDASANPLGVLHNPYGSVSDQRECFYYDQRQRLTGAHTVGGSGACAASHSANPIGAGPAPYSKSFQYDSRMRMTNNDGRGYSYSATAPTGQCQSGTQTSKRYSVSSIGSGNGQPAETFQYDCNGSISSRTAGSETTTYAFSETNRLVGVAVGNSNGSVNTYSSNGQRVMRRDPDYGRTIYLGSTELRWTRGSGTSGTVSASRTYPGGAVRTFDGTLNYVAKDHQATIVATVSQSSGSYTLNSDLPYGELRAGGPINDRSFLGQVDDSAQGLTYLNNRHYDQSTGIFVSVDPLVTMTGEPYIYGSANPVTFSDPTGLCNVSNHFCHINGAIKKVYPWLPPPSGPTDRQRDAADYSYNTIVGPLALHGHHNNPKFLGGRQKQELTYLTERVHRRVHDYIYDRIERDFGFNGRPAKGRGGQQVRDRIDEQASTDNPAAERTEWVRDVIYDDEFEELVGDDVADEIRGNFDHDYPRLDYKYVEMWCAGDCNGYTWVPEGTPGMIGTPSGVPIAPGGVVSPMPVPGLPALPGVPGVSPVPMLL